MTSPVFNTVLTCLLYLFYGVIIGVSCMPSICLMYLCLHWFRPFGALLPILCLSVACGVALMLYFLTGTIVMAAVIRLLSLGIKAGKYPVTSFTMFRWLVFSGLYNCAGWLILNKIPMTFLITMFFRIIGAKIGKNVQINTWFLNDAYLLEIGDNVVIGGKTDVSCHSFEGGSLILNNVTIGCHTLIGQRCYISPGTTIGENSVIGQYVYVRKNTVVPPRTVLSSIAGLPLRTVARIERQT